MNRYMKELLAVGSVIVAFGVIRGAADLVSEKMRQLEEMPRSCYGYEVTFSGRTHQIPADGEVKSYWHVARELGYPEGSQCWADAMQLCNKKDVLQPKDIIQVPDVPKKTVSRD